jgi:myo-inositol-1(or 4)-monophosphatase
VIDPIDGTSNFSRGIPHFAVCIGLLENNVPVVGAVFNPVTQELFSFKKGSGAFLNGAPIQVSSITELAQSHVFLRAGRNPENWDWGGEAYKKLLAHANKTNSFAGSALDLCFIAAGRIEAVIYGNLNTMDVASAFGILKEAGGVAAGADGGEITFTTKPHKWFAANNSKILDEVRTLLG